MDVGCAATDRDIQLPGLLAEQLYQFRMSSVAETMTRRRK
jgi:hypothetical protein